MEDHISLYTGLLGAAALCAPGPIVILFRNGTSLDFATLGEAYAFLNFYKSNLTSRTQNPGTIYQLTAGVWVEKPELPSMPDATEPDHQCSQRSA
jgi:hypothetical protein